MSFKLWHWQHGLDSPVALAPRAASKPSGLCWVDHACPSVHARRCLLLMLPRRCSCAGRCAMQAALCHSRLLISHCWYMAELMLGCL